MMVPLPPVVPLPLVTVCAMVGTIASGDSTPDVRSVALTTNAFALPEASLTVSVNCVSPGSSAVATEDAPVTLAPPLAGHAWTSVLAALAAIVPLISKVGSLVLRPPVAGAVIAGTGGGTVVVTTGVGTRIGAVSKAPL